MVRSWKSALAVLPSLAVVGGAANLPPRLVPKGNASRFLPIRILKSNFQCLLAAVATAIRPDPLANVATATAAASVATAVSQAVPTVANSIPSNIVAVDPLASSGLVLPSQVSVQALIPTDLVSDQASAGFVIPSQVTVQALIPTTLVSEPASLPTIAATVVASAANPEDAVTIPAAVSILQSALATVTGSFESAFNFGGDTVFIQAAPNPTDAGEPPIFTLSDAGGSFTVAFTAGSGNPTDGAQPTQAFTAAPFESVEATLSFTDAFGPAPTDASVQAPAPAAPTAAPVEPAPVPQQQSSADPATAPASQPAAEPAPASQASAQTAPADPAQAPAPTAAPTDAPQPAFAPDPGSLTGAFTLIPAGEDPTNDPPDFSFTNFFPQPTGESAGNPFPQATDATAVNPFPQATDATIGNPFPLQPTPTSDSSFGFQPGPGFGGDATFTSAYSPNFTPDGGLFSAKPGITPSQSIILFEGAAGSLSVSRWGVGVVGAALLAVVALI